MDRSFLSTFLKVIVDENKYSQFLNFFTFSFELNYFAKVSPGKKILFELICFLVSLFVRLRKLLSQAVFGFSLKFLLMLKK